jgi:hypothetical protein
MLTNEGIFGGEGVKSYLRVQIKKLADSGRINCFVTALPGCVHPSIRSSRKINGGRECETDASGIQDSAS